VERDFALELEFLMRKSGAEAAAFDFIVASGDRSYLPHGIASSKIIEEGDMVVVDFGARWQGYHSDISRTFKMGEWQPWERDLYKVILEAQEAAIKCLKPGMKACEIDGAARQVIKDAGYGEFFGHGLGHGVGLEIHEKPSLSPASEDILEEGMVFTLEPGIYLPGKGGVRIEDMVYLDSQGPQVITTLEKEVFL
jgi:Xaa-Pro aminopeptidase